MRAMSKSEIADRAGVSAVTLRKWLKNDEVYLRSQGVSFRQKVFPPQVVNYFIQKYCIENDP
jgi:transposase-like protein